MWCESGNGRGRGRHLISSLLAGAAKSMTPALSRFSRAEKKPQMEEKGPKKHFSHAENGDIFLHLPLSRWYHGDL